MEKDDLKILNAIKNDPKLKKCFLEMIDITNAPLGTLDNGDDAEEAVVSTMQETSNVVLQKWAEKKCQEAENQACKNPENRYHEKKS